MIGFLRRRIAFVRRDPWFLAATILLAVLVILVAVPQAWILRASLIDAETDAFTFGNFVNFFERYRFRQALINSLIISSATALFATLIAVPLAFCFARFQLPGKSVVLTLMFMATISPPFLGAYAWVLLLGRSGVVMQALRNAGVSLPFESITGMGGIIWVLTWFTFALIFIFSYNAFSNLDPSLEDAAMSVGAPRWRTVLQITVPLITPAILTGAYLTLVTAFADFGTPVLIGGNIPVMPVVVYYEFLNEVRTNPSMASAASIMMIATSTVLLMLQRFLLARRNYSVEGAGRRRPTPLARWKQIAILSVTGLALVITFTPHLVVLASSFMTWNYGILKWTFTLDNYARVFDRTLTPIYVSYFLAVVSTAVITVVGVMVAYVIVRRNYRVVSPVLNIAVMMPYLIPGTVLAIGLILTFNQQPILLTGTWVILVLAYFIRRLPYAVKTTEAALYQIHPALEDAAMSVGATPTRTFLSITARLVAPSVVAGAILVFLQVITELSATIMLYSSPWVPMTVAIFTNALEPAGPFGLASALTVILMASIYVPIFLLRRFLVARTVA